VKLLKNAFWLSACRIACDVLSFVLFAAISRAFGPAGTGEYSYAFAVGTLVALISTSGFEDYGIRQYARATDGTRAQLWQELLSTQCVQLALGLLALAVFILAGLIHANNLIVVLELSVYVIGWSISRTFYVPAMAAQSMVVPALTDLSCRFSAILSALLMVLFLRPPLPWLLAGFPVAGIALAALSMRNSIRLGAKPRLSRSWAELLATLRGTLPFAGADVLNQFYARADVLLIAYFLGNEKVGLYATDIKFVEVGLLPLILLGMAAYPLLSEYAARQELKFSLAAQDFVRLQFLLAGWLAMGIYWLIPLLIVPIFGERFSPSLPLLPFIAVFALLKGAEAAFYRVLYSIHRQTWYCISLLVGTVIIWSLNYLLIPPFGILGAIVAAIISTAVVDLMGVAGLAQRVHAAFLVTASARLLVALGVASLLALGTRRLGAGPWTVALVGTGAFPLLGASLGLIPHPRRSFLLQQGELSIHPPDRAASSQLDADHFT
jgi:O-antigen/teichoic acid export membrane protein